MHPRDHRDWQEDRGGSLELEVWPGRGTACWGVRNGGTADADHDRPGERPENAESERRGPDSQVERTDLVRLHGHENWADCLVFVGEWELLEENAVWHPVSAWLELRQILQFLGQERPLYGVALHTEYLDEKGGTLGEEADGASGQLYDEEDQGQWACAHGGGCAYNSFQKSVH